MPDPTRSTVSASQSAALFDASPYQTRFLLWHWLKGESLPQGESGRMRYGKQLQPAVIDDARQKLNLEVMPNFADEYTRLNGSRLGCTVDAIVVDPQRGRGTLETKCVFDYGVWTRDWAQGRMVPRHIEIQLQHQMVVGDGSKPYEWGVVAPWVCGELQDCITRHRDPTFEAALMAAADKIFAEVDAGQEPDPMGEAIEAPLIKQLFPVVAGMAVDLSTHERARDWAEAAASFARYRDDASFAEKAREAERGKLFSLLKAAQGAERVTLPGVTLRITQRKIPAHQRKESVQTIFKVVIGAELQAALDTIELMPPI